MNCSSMTSTTVQWYTAMQCSRMNFFLIPVALFTTSTLLIDPLLLFCIFRSSSLRQESRYLLLANNLLGDALFLIINLANLFSNALDLEIPYACCQAIMVTTVMTNFSTGLTITLMVIDTFVAVHWPLQYKKILPPSRTIKIIAFVWALAALYPFVLLLIFNKDNPESLKVCVVLLTLGCLGNYKEVGVQVYLMAWVIVCIVLIIYFYIRLYFVTKSSGIWSSRYSRARRTLLVHFIMLAMYTVPALIFTVQLTNVRSVSIEVSMWLNTVNLTVLMLLPRACSPYLYGLRNRKMYDTVKLMLWRRYLKRDTQIQQVHAPQELGTGRAF